MNELDIRDAVDKLLENAENELEIIFSRALRDVLNELDVLYRKHAERGVEPSYTTLNRYNRVHSMLARIAGTMTEEYNEIVRQINEMSKNVYLETYLKTHYLFQVFQAEEMGFTIPSNEVLLAAIVNPIEYLTLPIVLERHRNEIVYKLQLTIEQGLRHGRSYSDIAYEIERHIGFSRNKARTVARTEAGRVQSVASELTYEEASKTARVEKMWLSSLDHRVRMSHRKLDGQTADKDGYFHYRGHKAKAPLMFTRADLNINCRCVLISKVNGKLPIIRRGKLYNDENYQKKLQARIDKLRKEEGLSYAKAFRQAEKEVTPPSGTFNYLTYNEWFEKMRE